MRTFLFAWNSRNWPWDNLENCIIELNQTGHVTERWMVSSHRQIKVGDRAFLMHLGREPKGIMAAGTVASAAFSGEHWSDKSKIVHRVFIDFEVILNPKSDQLLGLVILKQGDLAKVNWTPRSSGVQIEPFAAEGLELLWLTLSRRSFLVRDLNRIREPQANSQYALRTKCSCKKGMCRTLWVLMRGLRS